MYLYSYLSLCFTYGKREKNSASSVSSVVNLSFECIFTNDFCQCIRLPYFLTIYKNA